MMSTEPSWLRTTNDTPACHVLSLSLDVASLATPYYSPAPDGAASGTTGGPSTLGFPSIEMFGIHSSQDGRYQALSPSSRITLVTSSERTIVASSSTAAPRPKPRVEGPPVVPEAAPSGAGFYILSPLAGEIRERGSRP